MIFHETDFTLLLRSYNVCFLKYIILYTLHSSFKSLFYFYINSIGEANVEHNTLAVAGINFLNWWHVEL